MQSEKNINIEKLKLYNELFTTISEINNSMDIKTIIETILKYLSKYIDSLETKLYLFNNNGKLIISTNDDELSLLDKTALHSEEEGIIDFALFDSVPKILLNTYGNLKNNSEYILCIPLKQGNKNIGIILALVNQEKNLLSDALKESLTFLAENTAMAISSILINTELDKVNTKLIELSRKALITARNASLGDITSAISYEFEAPIKIIETNLDLLQSGVGEPNMRVDVINKQLSKMKTINDKLSKLSNTFSENNKKEQLDIVEVIEEVILFTHSQFVRLGIKVERKYDLQNIYVFQNKATIEQILINILLSLKDTLDDYGAILLHVFKEKNNYVSILISDNGTGIPQFFAQNAKIPELNDNPKLIKAGLNIDMVKEIIDYTDAKIKITSIPYTGTTIKITFKQN